MNKSDYYLKRWLQEWENHSSPVDSPRTKWADGSPAFYKSIHQKVATYDLSKGEFPINTLRPTAIKGGFHEIQWFYQQQSSVFENLHPSVHEWWEGFTVGEYDDPYLTGIDCRHIGRTYGETVGRYRMTDKLLKGLIENPFGRRHQIDLWQEEQMMQDPKALPPCVFLSMWSVTQKGSARYLNITLVQRSMDGLMTFSINPTQYSMLALMIVSHLRYHTRINYKVGEMLHIVNDFHIYDRHEKYVPEILNKESTGIQPTIRIKEDKDFYKITWEDFEILDYKKPEPLSGKLEIAL